MKIGNLEWDTVPGWMNCHDLYDEVALTTPPYTSVVEVGVAFGRSLLYLAHRIKQTGKDIRVYGVDRWEPYEEHDFIYQNDPPEVESKRVAWEAARKHGGVYQAFTHYLKQSGLDDLRILHMDSVEAACYLWGARYAPTHFVFIDAEHTAESVRADLNAWWNLGPEWMAGDDYNPGSEIDFPGVWKEVHAKFGAENVAQRQTTSWVVRRSDLERKGRG